MTNLILAGILILVSLIAASREHKLRTFAEIAADTLAALREDFNALSQANLDLRNLHADQTEARRAAEAERDRLRLAQWSGKPAALAR